MTIRHTRKFKEYRFYEKMLELEYQLHNPKLSKATRERVAKALEMARAIVETTSEFG